MFTISEVAIENKRSVFPRMHYFFSKNLVEVCGRAGEGAARAAVRGHASACAKELRLRHEADGLLTNVKSYYLASNKAKETRERGICLSLDQEVCIREVYTCPYANIWDRYGASDYGIWFCEEYEKAAFEEYTKGAGQMHLSSHMTEKRFNSCRFACYFRKANISTEEAEKCFDADIHKPSKEETFSEKYHQDEGKLCFSLYCHFVSAALDKCGDKGVDAVVQGLRELKEDSVETLEDQAIRTLNRCDAAFASDNFPFPLDIDDRLYSEKICGIDDETFGYAKALIEKHLLMPVKASLR